MTAAIGETRQEDYMMQTAYQPSELETGNQNLLALALILDDADEKHVAKGEPTYNQGNLWCEHDEGQTGSCALAHWWLEHPAPSDDPDSSRTFALDDEEWGELFSTVGCNAAPTAKDAAAYLRAFVSRRTERLEGVSSV